MKHMIINFDIQRFKFKEWACQAFEFEDLDRIHERPDSKVYPSYVERMTDYRSILEKAYPKCRSILEGFVRQKLEPAYGGKIETFQSPPTFRVHFDQTGLATTFHRDRDYGQPDGVLNVWLPLTNVWGNKSIWIEQDDADHYLPMELKYGQALVFDGANLRHGTKSNDTGSSRVSFDFRFLPPGVPDRSM